MKSSRSLFVDVRGLRYHCRCWGADDAPTLFALHGWMDVSASFQFLVDALRGAWRVIAPDWRGFGLTQWSGADSYWFPDYVADLDRLLAHFSPGTPARLIGHSMGGNVACLYAGVRSERVAKLVNLEGFGLAPQAPEQAPKRYARWLGELAGGVDLRPYADFDALAARLRQNNGRLSPERARFLAGHWGEAMSDGRVRLRADPAHKRINPVQYRLDEAIACWRAVRAPVLWIEGAESETRKHLHIGDADYKARKACFAIREDRRIAAAGHMLHHDQPERLAALIEAFMLR